MLRSRPGFFGAFCIAFYTCNAMLAQYMLLVVVCLSQASVLSKRTQIERVLAQRLPSTYTTL